MDETPLHKAAGSDDSLGVVELLLNRGARLDVMNFFGETPLHRAAGSDSLGVVELLLNRGARVDATDDFDEAPIDKTEDQAVRSLLRNFRDGDGRDD